MFLEHSSADENFPWSASRESESFFNIELSFAYAWPILRTSCPWLLNSSASSIQNKQTPWFSFGAKQFIVNLEKFDNLIQFQGCRIREWLMHCLWFIMWKTLWYEKIWINTSLRNLHIYWQREPSFQIWNSCAKIVYFS